MTATQPTTNTLAIDPETRQISGFANWEASPEAGEIEVILPIPSGVLPPSYSGIITVKTVCDSGTLDGVATIFSTDEAGECYALRSIVHDCDGTDTHGCEPPLKDNEPQSCRTGLVFRFCAIRPANCELVLTPNFGV